MCDIPGIIEGAHNNVGLGHEFLRHIRRCGTLCLILDMAGIDDRSRGTITKNFCSSWAIRSGDAQQTALVAANKMDEDRGPN